MKTRYIFMIWAMNKPWGIYYGNIPFSLSTRKQISLLTHEEKSDLHKSLEQAK